MLGAISDTLPLGLGIAMNPIAIVAGILILASAGARSSSVAFTLGWMLGLAILLALALLLHQQVASNPDTPRDAVSLFKIVVGVILIAGATRLILFPVERQGEMPRWMRFLDQIGIQRAFGIGLFLAVFSLKNVILIAGAATLIGAVGVIGRGVLITLVVFLLVSTAGILIPFLVHLSGGERADARLATWRGWLLTNVNLITAVVMGILGVLMIGHGVAALA
jgi:hypothetical protein